MFFSLLETLQGIAWVLLVLLAFALVAFASVRLARSRRAVRGLAL